MMILRLFIFIVCASYLCACARLQERAQESDLLKGKTIEVNIPFRLGD